MMYALANMLCEIRFVSNFTPLEQEFPQGWKAELKKQIGSYSAPQLFMNIAKDVHFIHFLSRITSATIFHLSIYCV